MVAVHNLASCWIVATELPDEYRGRTYGEAEAGGWFLGFIDGEEGDPWLGAGEHPAAWRIVEQEGM